MILILIANHITEDLPHHWAQLINISHRILTCSLL